MSGGSDVRIGVAQLEFVEADLASPERRAAAGTAAIDRLAAAGADVVVLPELAATGYVLDADHLGRHAETVEPGPPGPGRPVLAAWAAAARRHGVAVVGGLAERTAHALYNTAVAIGPHGEVVGRYRKLHLFGAEHRVFAPGDLGLPVFPLGSLRAGLLICYDLRFPEAARILALQGAEVLLVPTAWIGGFDRAGPRPGRFIGQIEAALVHANLNQVYVVCADFAGRQRELEMLGQSVAIDPYGVILAGPLPETGPADFVVDVDAATVRSARHRGEGISPRENRRTDVYADLLGYRAPTGR